MNPYKQHFLRMAIYNRWAFQQLYIALDTSIPDENYQADSGLYFRSIHGTLVHLLLSSKLWYNRLAKCSSYSHTDEIYPHDINSYWSRSADEWEQAVSDRKDLQEAILIESNRWIEYVKELSVHALMNEEKFDYIDTKSIQHKRTRSEVLDHIFNHNTHHRGQITAIITKYLGQDSSPILDLVAMPKEEYIN